MNDESLLAEYHKRVLPHNAKIEAIGAFVCGFLIFAMAFTDVLFIDNSSLLQAVLLVRFFAAITLIAIGLRLLRPKSVEQYEYLSLLLNFIVALVLFSVSFTRTTVTHFLFDAVFVFSIYGFFEARLRTSSIVPFMYTIAKLLMLVFYFSFSTHEVIMVFTALVLANVGGLITAHKRNTMSIRNARLILQVQQEKDKVQQQNDVNQTLLSMIAHDLRTPLGNVAHHFEFVLTHLKGSEQEKLLWAMLNDFKSIYSTFDNLIYWVRSLDGKLQPQPEPLLIHSILNDEFILLKSQASIKKIQFVLNIPQDYTLTWDPQMFRVCMRNMISNAIKYSTENGSIHIGIDQEGLFVQDFGKGMSPETRATLFEKFSPSTKGTHKESGFGMGLYICSLMVHAHNSHLLCKSKLGQGTKFTILV
jgi:signal transduction histidine kinase